jgi:hypothetical protein
MTPEPSRVTCSPHRRGRLAAVNRSMGRGYRVATQSGARVARRVALVAPRADGVWFAAFVGEGSNDFGSLLMSLAHDRNTVILPSFGDC